MRANRNTGSRLALLMMTLIVAVACIAMSLGCSDDNVVEPVIVAAQILQCDLKLDELKASDDRLACHVFSPVVILYGLPFRWC